MIRFWMSKVRVTAGSRGGKVIHSRWLWGVRVYLLVSLVLVLLSCYGCYLPVSSVLCMIIWTDEAVCWESTDVAASWEQDACQSSKCIDLQVRVLWTCSLSVMLAVYSVLLIHFAALLSPAWLNRPSNHMAKKCKTLNTVTHGGSSVTHFYCVTLC